MENDRPSPLEEERRRWRSGDPEPLPEAGNPPQPSDAIEPGEHEPTLSDGQPWEVGPPPDESAYEPVPAPAAPPTADPSALEEALMPLKSEFEPPRSVEPSAAKSEAAPPPSEAAPTAVRVPSPVVHPPQAEPLPVVEATPKDEQAIVLDRITELRQLRLMERIDELLNDIYDRLSKETGQDTVEEVLKLLKTARHTLIENPRDYDTAEYYTLRAKMLLDRFQSVRRDSYRWAGLGLGLYEVVLLAVVVVGWAAGESLSAWSVRRGVPVWALAPWTTMMASSAGAILGAIWALVEHVAIRQDFNKQHALWYLGSPVTGALLGVLVYFMMHTGALAMGVTVPASQASAPLEPDWFLLTLAALIGFQQNVALDLFERFIKLIRPARAQE